jgi:hypothetical protein
MNLKEMIISPTPHITIMIKNKIMTTPGIHGDNAGEARNLSWNTVRCHLFPAQKPVITAAPCPNGTIALEC